MSSLLYVLALLISTDRLRYSYYRLNEFDGYEHPEWRRKRVINADTEAALKGTQTKIVLVATGMFLEWLFSPGRTLALLRCTLDLDNS